jgi:chemotaxis protein methyltransferase CheR
MDDASFKKLLDILHLSWRGYRKARKGVKKRLSRHMQQIGCQDVNVYVDRITSHPDMLKETQCLMTVSVSRFFRDRLLWKVLEEKLIPHILNGNPDRVFIWSAGSALGQEAYSIKMLWRLQEKKRGRLPSLHVLATDINPDYQKKAMAGLYSHHAVRDVPADLLDTCFYRIEDQFAVCDDLKSDMVWEISDLTKPPHYLNRFHIIFLRNNLLTYYERETTLSTLPKIIDNLALDGYLIIGARESLPGEYPCLSRSHDHSYIFQKMEKRIKDSNKP